MTKKEIAKAIYEIEKPYLKQDESAYIKRMCYYHTKDTLLYMLERRKEELKGCE